MAPFRTRSTPSLLLRQLRWHRGPRLRPRLDRLPGSRPQVLRWPTPEITITTPNGWSYILAALQTQQQFTTNWTMKALSSVPDVEGLKGTVIYDDILTPGAAWGADFPTNYIGTSNKTTTFSSASTATGTTSPSQLPASTTITTGETIWALSGSAWKYCPIDNLDFLFGRRQNEVYNNNTNDAS